MGIIDRAYKLPKFKTINTDTLSTEEEGPNYEGSNKIFLDDICIAQINECEGNDVPRFVNAIKNYEPSPHIGIYSNENIGKLHYKFDDSYQIWNLHFSYKSPCRKYDNGWLVLSDVHRDYLEAVAMAVSQSNEYQAEFKYMGAIDENAKALAEKANGISNETLLNLCKRSFAILMNCGRAIDDLNKDEPYFIECGSDYNGGQPIELQGFITMVMNELVETGAVDGKTFPFLKEEE